MHKKPVALNYGYHVHTKGKKNDNKAEKYLSNGYVLSNTHMMCLYANLLSRKQLTNREDV